MDSLLSALFSSSAEEQYILDCMAYLMILMAACTFVSLLFLNVPYGRYASSTYGFPVNAKLAWFVQELPAFLLPICLLVWASSAKSSLLTNQLLIAMFLCHYTQSFMQIRYLSHYAEYPADWVTHPCFIAGSALWLLGWLTNLHSDHILRNLRRSGESGYKIPRGGMFEYVSGANFFGEITEWTGFALAGQSVHSAAFAIFTAVVLSSRAFAHHKWYLAKFEDYPKTRKALIPFLV
ncbi:3-oxo-5-alpha-steroid 4-dehydrogenase 1 isoform X2 [Phycodurus eques]|uniref:3-oxo-5-alpha-steroid 4-dehydrogenase 1 isoform X2 n=1 Tax=Phycodurus eques TaxID=693459 RepID=UPI002ACDD412|nr:3-oxo-5-alpha-steroid 4-dehydrogenase 1 isoform X2 [Phycodurus eques]